jgi:hypothetical protein
VTPVTKKVSKTMTPVTFKVRKAMTPVTFADIPENENRKRAPPPQNRFWEQNSQKDKTIN